MNTVEIYYPLISVVIPTYNRSLVVVRAIESVLAQTYQNLEIVIVDDGSTDDTKNRLIPYKSNKKIKYYYKQNGGVSSARNYGIRHSGGQYIAFLDSDDEFEKEKLMIQFNETSKYDVNLSVCSSVEIKGNKRKLINNQGMQSLFNQSIFFKMNFSISGSFFMIKRSPEILFNENLVTGEDIDFVLKHLAINKCLYIDKPLVRRHKEYDSVRLSINPEIKIKGILETIKIYNQNPYHFHSEEKIEKIAALRLRLGYWYFFNNNFREGRTEIKLGLKVPQSLKRKLYFMLLYTASLSPSFFRILKNIGIWLWQKGYLAD